MSKYTKTGGAKIKDRARSSFAMLGFGLALLAFLVAIERPQWFVLRPASGTAAALAEASSAPPQADPHIGVAPGAR